MRHLLDVTDLSVQEIDELISVSEEIVAHPERFREACKYRKCATLFFEPSTRTRLSFETAMIDLGGSVVGFESGGNSSAAKGESMRDTARVVGNYVDIIVMRTPSEGAAYVSATVSPVPVINAGDGGHCHPTQTLADLLTIHREAGRLDHLKIGVCGDLKFGRTVHSLLSAMTRYRGTEVVCISPKELSLPSYMVQKLQSEGVPFLETNDLESVLPDLDILYMTRIQKERFDDVSEYERLKDCYCLTAEKMKKAKSTLRVLHPLPRVNEISVAVDQDPRSAYFRQTFNGKLMRMALILKLIKENDGVQMTETRKTELAAPCKNKKCIFQSEQELEPRFYRDAGGCLRCLYCDQAVEGT